MTAISGSITRSTGTGRLLLVPTTLWGYAVLRSAAFLAPTWTEGGRIGLGVFVVGFLFVRLVRGRSRSAWRVLVFVDLLSACLLVGVWATDRSLPVAAPALATAAAVSLLLPSTRHYVDR